MRNIFDTEVNGERSNLRTLDGNKDSNDRSPESLQSPSTGTLENNRQEYKVERIVGDRTIKGRTQYKVRWEGYETEDDTWEDEDQLHCDVLLEEYLSEKGGEELREKGRPGASGKRKCPGSTHNQASVKNKKKNKEESQRTSGPSSSSKLCKTKCKEKKINHDSD